MLKTITVSQLNGYIKGIFEAEVLLQNIDVIGEVFGISISRNIMYFSLRDNEASIPCVCFYPALFDSIKEGEEMIVTGSPNFYCKGGKLSFVVTKVEKNGQGKLYEEFLKLKDKLEKEGLFSESHKKPIPQNIRRIGVITSSEGAVIQDIKQVSWRRNPGVDIVLYSTRVQGKGAENEIAHAIEVMGEYDKIDVIIVARGGGSLEDLWAYNTEIVARATYNCPKPIVSAVGHETDFTIIDFVSDLRASTPSVAAEVLNANLEEKKENLITLSYKFKNLCFDFVEDKTQNITVLQNYLINALEKTIINSNSTLDKLAMRFERVASRFLEERSYNLGLLENSLAKLNPTALLKQGYAKVEQCGKPITSKASLDYNADLDIYFGDGKVSAKPVK